MIPLCSCCFSTFHNRINVSQFFPLSSFRGVSDFFFPLFLLLFRPKLLPEEERRRENMGESGDSISCPSSSPLRLFSLKTHAHFQTQSRVWTFNSNAAGIFTLRGQSMTHFPLLGWLSSCLSCRFMIQHRAFFFFLFFYLHEIFCTKRCRVHGAA